MKKRAVLGILVASILLISVVYSADLVSAGLLGDAWSKITGKAVDNESEGEESEPLECMPTPQFCPDGKTFCPSKKDEQGCTYYDCDACESEEPVEEICGDNICQEGEKCDTDWQNGIDFGR